MIEPRCSAFSAALAEPQSGTAATARAWVCLEQPGPWGRDALLESHLDPELGAELVRRSSGTGVRVLLIRRPGTHPDRHVPQRRRVYLASCAPGASWLERADLTDPEELLELDFTALGQGRSTGFGTPETGPLLLVCTNGKRDVCCALAGRPIVADLAARHGDAVWECTHTGGHRFSPTGVLLPSGYLYGRLDTGFAEELLAARAVVVDRCRGRSYWSKAGQVAEVAVRARLGERGDALVVEPERRHDATTWTVLVRHADGREWQVSVTERALPPARPTGCGKEPAIPTALVVTAVDQLVPVA
ncbi:sucrase ferredoxin [Umezawaea endophytica]|uniref:Sucrase ferredoxin n=1 Tax=Umezawaea endophytica TaxID=1654476 RepID=A0A9X3AH50_9PSEU|nr:sucrase ferredoxin [Umezawaea endophytica]MCS7480511.1 sucrase ferredoxin [Umezawaea endophytica]